MTQVASYAGLGAILYFPFSGTSMWWVIPMLFCTVLLLMGITVGMHRLFCHQSFETNRFWHWVLAIFGTLAFYGSTIQWSSMHMTHHEFADTEKDPHHTGIRYLFWKKNHEIKFNLKVLRRLARDPMHMFLHRYYVLIPITYTIALLALGGFTALMCLYLIPLGWLRLVGGFHQVLSHGKSGAKSYIILN